MPNGEQYNYLDHATCLGFTRTGDDEHPKGVQLYCLVEKKDIKK